MYPKTHHCGVIEMSEIRTPALKYFHIRNKFSDQRGGFTIAYKEDLNSVQYGVAYCSKKDQFEKLIGRAVAESKFKYHFLMDQPVGEGEFKEVGEIVIHSGFQNPIHIKYHILLDILFSPETNKDWVKQIIADELMFMSIPKNER
jgi:hypothetical protein